ncbi:unnamed protein product [Rotaria magnacalcarata]|uniref:DH domain-containing protein n=1 Tax=Rotaria magnacalcarata TaxID=392030 RepID=A0A814R4W2_9BILA|nr:unnamed protein product [Rotaria magnacalcarata]CAF2266947.1 unnamed protein product [Rotaria magnacalcarata]CAF3923027.1 unnamed protein product [Rotaria magnacalcarata]
MRKIRFRYIKENGQATSVTVRCSLKRNASLISEALRHYQRLERQNDEEVSTRKLDKQNRRNYQHVKECKFQPIVIEQTVPQKIKPTTNHHFDPIQLRRKQCSSTLIDEDLPIISNSNLNCFSSSSSSGFRSNSHSLSNQILSTSDDVEILNENFIKRSNIIKEIYKTEYDYLGHLKNLVDGYLKKMRLRTDLFSEKQIELLMGNIEEIYEFQQSFFQLLKLSIDDIHPHESLIGKCFLLYKEEFKKYSDYCINHPLSCLELSKLENNIIYRNFFETCRLQANMIELKLEAFLLTPIQRICQYPLQLNELLKYTSYEHKDFNNIQQALHTMRNVASYINERKRRMDYVEIIHKWQHTVECWQGKDILVTSTQGLGRADAYLYQNGKKEPVILFLFDHVLIICRKDRRSTLIYIGRADLDNAEIEDLVDGKGIRLDDENLVHVFFSWRLHDRTQNKTFLFSHRTPLDKIQMMDALEYERAYVKENLTKGLEVPLYTRLASLKTQQYLANQSTRTFPCITKQHRSVSAILRASSSPCSNQTSLLTTAIYHTPLRRRKASLPRFVRCSSPDSSADETFRSIKSRLRFWS